MPITPSQPPAFKPGKDIEIGWDNFRKGVNLLLNDREIEGDELALATNLFLVGKGVPTKRWGSDNYFFAGENGIVRGLMPYYAKVSGASVNELLAVTDDGFLVKKSGASYSIITGASFASGYFVDGAQLDNKMYLVGGNRELVRYDGFSLQGFATISAPANLQATNISGVSGTSVWSWTVTSVSDVGETIDENRVSLVNLPDDLSNTTVLVTWGAVSAPSGVLKGYNIYRGFPGDETFLATVGPQTTSYQDYGLQASELTLPPVDDTTGGPKGRFIEKFQDRLVISGIDGESTAVMISGRWPWHERYSEAYTGSTVYIDPDSGDPITGLATTDDRIIVFKRRSVWQITLEVVQLGNYRILNPQYKQIALGRGASSYRAITQVENDVFFFGDAGLYVLGYEPNIAVNVLRTREISAKLRPYIETLSEEDLENCSLTYTDYKVVLTFPDKREFFVYDRERLSFMGPEKLPYGVSGWQTYYDSMGNEKRLAMSYSDTYVVDFAKTYQTDRGEIIPTTLRTKKEDFKDWSVMKTVKDMTLLFRAVSGSIKVNLRLEERSGNTVTVKTFNIQGALGVAGWGTDLWGTTKWGDTVTAVSISSEDIVRWTNLYKTARAMQIEIITTGRNDKYEFLGVRVNAQSQGQGSLPGSWRV